MAGIEKGETNNSADDVSHHLGGTMEVTPKDKTGKEDGRGHESD